MTTRKYLVGITSIVLVGTLGASTLASAASDTTTGRLPAATTAEKCEHQDQIRTRMEKMQDRLTERAAHLQTRRDAAAAAGKDDAVARLDRALQRVAKMQERLTARMAKFDNWVSTNC